MMQQTAPPLQRISPEVFFHLQERAEQTIRAGIPSIGLVVFLLGCRDLNNTTEPNTIADIDRAVETITHGKQKIQNTLALLEPHATLPMEIIDVGWCPIDCYRDLWDEPLTLLEDALLFIAAYRDNLLAGTSGPGEDRERQRAIAPQLYYLIESLIDVLHSKIPAWRAAVRQDINEGTGRKPTETQKLELEAKGGRRS